MAPNASKSLPVVNILTSEELNDSLFASSRQSVKCSAGRCCASLLQGQTPVRANTRKSSQAIIGEALDFLNEYYTFVGRLDTPEHEFRMRKVIRSLQTVGSYELTSEELEFGVRQGWRNTPDSLDRVCWRNLNVLDCRHVRTGKEMFDALCVHLQTADNNGQTRPTVTVFPRSSPNGVNCRIWNDEILGYAGYEQEDGSIKGDPANVKFTQLCQSLGWKSAGTAFDVLPLVLNGVGEDPQFFDLPKETVRQVNISHPDYPWFSKLRLRWFALPSTSSSLLDIGGLEFPAAPLTGIAMSADIASRHLAFPHRYNMLQTVADKMSLDTSTPSSLWKDAALVEINVAVLHSFRTASVTIWDHHQASESFVSFLKEEFALRGGCPGDWTKLVSPISSSITSVFHQEMLDYSIYPRYVPQIPAVKTHKWHDSELEKQVMGCSDGHVSFRSLGRAVMLAMGLHKRCLNRRVKATVLYASETGKAESFAKRVAKLFTKAFNVQLVCMKDYDFDKLTQEQVLLVVTSTFGSGEAPGNGQKFWRYLSQLEGTVLNNNRMSSSGRSLEEALNNAHNINLDRLRFGVFALGSTAYPDFCQFGKFCHNVLESLGAQAVLPLATADEIKGQETPLRKWMQEIFEKSCHDMGIPIDESINASEDEEEKMSAMSRLVPQPSMHPENLCSALGRLHQKEVSPCRILSRTDLQSSNSQERTILVCLESKNNGVLDYQPGDHIGVFPVNNANIVAQLLQRLSIDSDTSNQVVQIHAPSTSGSNPSWSPVDRLPACNLHTAFSNYLDVTSTPSQSILKYFASCAKDEIERRSLEELSKDDEAYSKWRSLTAPGLYEVLQEFPSTQPNVATLLLHLPLLQPRFYSVSSSPSAHPGQIHLTVGINRFRGEDCRSAWKYGVCSKHIDNMEIGEELVCFVRRAPTFHLPNEVNHPVLLIGAGTGLAPFRGFWQQRKFDRASGRRKSLYETGWRAIIRVASRDNDDDLVGESEEMTSPKMALYFGCRHPEQDDIYRHETFPLLEQDILTSVRTAYSRLDGQPKKYVQNLLEEDARDVYRQLTAQQGHVYVCGNVSMATGVRNTIQHILRTKGSMSEHAADVIMKNIKAEGRYHEDIFG